MLLTQLVALDIINMAKSKMCNICIIKKASFFEYGATYPRRVPSGRRGNGQTLFTLTCPTHSQTRSVAIEKVGD
jgi:hypothetical protein